MHKPRIPVVMYHGIGVPSPDWLWGALTMRHELFLRQVHLLKSCGYRSIFLDEYHDAQASGGSQTERRVVFTFDDGYLDNWVFALPIMRREGWRAVVYVNPDFIDPGETPRPTLEEVWNGKLAVADLPALGFLNRAELRLMQESGLFDICSHSITHTWYPTSPEIVDHHRPGLDTPWLAWNARPDRKHAYLVEDQSGFVPLGTPIHHSGRSLGFRRYLPDPAPTAAAVAYVAAGGGAAFFERRNWQAELREVTGTRDVAGRPETDEEMMARFRHEIVECRRILADITGSEVAHFCWPGGAYCDASWPLAEEAGYRTICVSRRDRDLWKSDDPRLVRRIGCGNFVTFRGNRYLVNDPVYLLWACEKELGHADVKWRLRWKKLVQAIRCGFKADYVPPAQINR